MTHVLSKIDDTHKNLTHMSNHKMTVYLISLSHGKRENLLNDVGRERTAERGIASGWWRSFVWA